MSVSARATTFRREPAVRLTSGATSAVFLPSLGMTGVSLRHDGGEYLASRGGLVTLRAGRTAGLPLLAPWANRLSARHYRLGSTEVDLEPSIADGSVRVDANGLPIHGLLAGRSVWAVEDQGRDGDAAWMRAAIDVDHPAFPFPHRVRVTASLVEGSLAVSTSVHPTGAAAVPVAFGWHPYLRVPGTPRNCLRLVLPDRTPVALDARGVPVGRDAAITDQVSAARVLPAERAPIERRTLDALFRLGPGPADRVLALEGQDGRGIALDCGAGYRHAQVWVPPGAPYAALEPMTAATDALTVGCAELVGPGECFTAAFTLRLT